MKIYCCFPEIINLNPFYYKMKNPQPMLFIITPSQMFETEAKGVLSESRKDRGCKKYRELNRVQNKVNLF